MALNPRSSKGIVDAASWCCVFLLVSLIFICIFRGSSLLQNQRNFRGSHQLLSMRCDEIYEVGEGETLHTISDKCGDPFIVEKNPHIHDPDDVFPGLVIKITPLQLRYYIDYKFMKKKVKRYLEQIEVGAQNRQNVLRDFSMLLDYQGIGAVVGVLSHNLADLHDLQQCQGCYISIYEQPSFAHQVSSRSIVCMILLTLTSSLTPLVFAFIPI